MQNNIFINTEQLKNTFAYTKNVENFIDQVLKLLNYTNWDISIMFCEDDFIQQLNSQYREIDAPTDVLSFPQEQEYQNENDEIRFNAGDIVISLPALKRNTQIFSVGENEEMKRLLVHGILHLSGLDHGSLHVSQNGTILDDNDKEVLTSSEEYEMLEKQENLMKQLRDFIVIEEKDGLF